ncbi:unnamed protein product [Vitrella brassicaformis CCMP3155]|uniref:FCP1 homology domain-containing protein n=4 Tax=Vitrella brassicaformis TaxID=1169539 RepID=A0A0G4F7Z3_VITBC|nr:unnamed protein product [Vitrella brassicaformis CCMP3155]|eukprot:CEM08664.1 unnamed protein product [Vitrella brassicaformis CCMP3155]
MELCQPESRPKEMAADLHGAGAAVTLVQGLERLHVLDFEFSLSRMQVMPILTELLSAKRPRTPRPTGSVCGVGLSSSMVATGEAKMRAVQGLKNELEAFREEMNKLHKAIEDDLDRLSVHLPIKSLCRLRQSDILGYLTCGGTRHPPTQAITLLHPSPTLPHTDPPKEHSHTSKSRYAICSPAIGDDSDLLKRAQDAANKAMLRRLEEFIRDERRDTVRLITPPALQRYSQQLAVLAGRVQRVRELKVALRQCLAKGVVMELHLDEEGRPTKKAKQGGGGVGGGDEGYHGDDESGDMEMDDGELVEDECRDEREIRGSFGSPPPCPPPTLIDEPPETAHKEASASSTKTKLPEPPSFCRRTVSCREALINSGENLRQIHLILDLDATLVHADAVQAIAVEKRRPVPDAYQADDPPPPLFQPASRLKRLSPSKRVAGKDDDGAAVAASGGKAKTPRDVLEEAEARLISKKVEFFAKGAYVDRLVEYQLFVRPGVVELLQEAFQCRPGDRGFFKVHICTLGKEAYAKAIQKTLEDMMRDAGVRDFVFGELVAYEHFERHHKIQNLRSTYSRPSPVYKKLAVLAEKLKMKLYDLQCNAIILDDSPGVWIEDFAHVVPSVRWCRWPSDFMSRHLAWAIEADPPHTQYVTDRQLYTFTELLKEARTHLFAPGGSCAITALNRSISTHINLTMTAPEVPEGMRAVRFAFPEGFESTRDRKALKEWVQSLIERYGGGVVAVEKHADIVLHGDYTGHGRLRWTSTRSETAHGRPTVSARDIHLALTSFTTLPAVQAVIDGVQRRD